MPKCCFKNNKVMPELLKSKESTRGARPGGVSTRRTEEKKNKEIVNNAMRNAKKTKNNSNKNSGKKLKLYEEN